MKDLANMTLVELRQKAKELSIKGWWNMKKVELIKAIEDASTVSEVIEDEVQEVKHKKNQKRLIEYNGKTQTLTAWAKELGIRHQTLYNRIVMKGWDIDKAFETSPKKGVKHVG